MSETATQRQCRALAAALWSDAEVSKSADGRTLAVWATVPSMRLPQRVLHVEGRSKIGARRLLLAALLRRAAQAVETCRREGADVRADAITAVIDKVKETTDEH